MKHDAMRLRTESAGFLPKLGFISLSKINKGRTLIVQDVKHRSEVYDS